MGTRKENNLEVDNLFLLRCIVTKVCNGHFEAKDYNGKKYIIKKNEASKNFKEGTDSTFYATKNISGWFFKKIILYPLTSSEYEELVGKDNEMIIAVGKEY